MPKINENQRLENMSKIVDVAKDLFYQEGYNKTSVNDIIKKAGISKGRFYIYFQSKEDLFHHIIADVDKKIITKDRDESKTTMEASGLSDYIRFRLERYNDENVRRQGKYTLEFWSSIKMSDSQKELLDSRYDKFVEDIRSVIQTEQQRGSIGPVEDLESYIHVLMATIDGMVLLDTVLEKKIRKQTIAVAADIFIKYLEVGNDNI